MRRIGPGIFEAVPMRPRWTGGTALVPLAGGFCPLCERELDLETVDQPALFIHAGHGATERTTTRHCVCGWRMVEQRQEVRPG